MANYSGVLPFRFWVQHTLPLVYDDSLSYYELLAKVVDYINKLIADGQLMIEEIEALKTAFEQLKTYVDTYFDNLDLTSAINAKLDELAEDGTLARLIAPMLSTSGGDALYNIVLGGTPVVGCLGDSLTYGYDVAGDTQSVTNYPDTLYARLTATPADHPMVHNYGISGAPSRRWTEEYADALADHCNICIFMFGANDFRLSYGLTELLENAEAFIRTCKADGIIPMVCSTPPYYGTQADRYQNGQLVADMIKAVALANNAIYIPVFEELQKSITSGALNAIKLLSDGVHFTTYRPLADIITAYGFPMLVANKGPVIVPWRNPGLEYANVSIADVSQALSNNGRVISFHSNTTWTLRFYADKPFKISTITADYSASAEVTWRLAGPAQTDAQPWGVTAGQAESTIDYYLSKTEPDEMREVDLFPDRQGFTPGYYTLSMFSLVRGQGAVQLTPVLWLCDVYIKPLETLIALAE